MLRLSIGKMQYRSDVEALTLDVRTKLRLVLEQAAIETIAYLRSLTSEMRPPAGWGGAPRPAHPGHWADVTGVLANSYGWSIEPLADGWRLILANTAEYAIHLEARDGYFVLSGVADAGGPVEVALQAALAKIAPGWTLTVGAVRGMMLLNSG